VPVLLAEQAAAAHTRGDACFRVSSCRGGNVKKCGWVSVCVGGGGQRGGWGGGEEWQYRVVCASEQKFDCRMMQTCDTWCVCIT
jgi:hypothetical protein